MKALLRRWAATKLVAHTLSLLEKLDPSTPHLLRILTYHRVDYPQAKPELSPRLLSATPESFEEQMRIIKQNYTPVTAQQVLENIYHKQPLPPHPVLITFDDGYMDFEQYAWPILERYAIPAVLFIATDYPDNPQRHLWWDRLYHALHQTQHKQVSISEKQNYPLHTSAEKMRAFRSISNQIKAIPHHIAMPLIEEVCTLLEVEPHTHNYIMSWDQIQAVSQAGVEIAAHTCSHPILPQVSVDDAITEAIQSRYIVKEKVGYDLPIFAYPSGGASTAIAQHLANAGFKLAFTTRRGINNLPSENPLLLKRININYKTPLNVIRGQLLGNSRFLYPFLG